MCGDRLIYDALIAGGSLEGCIAAVELAGRGRKVLLTEENGSLGGMCTNGLEVWLPAESEEEEKVRQYRERILREAYCNPLSTARFGRHPVEKWR